MKRSLPFAQRAQLYLSGYTIAGTLITILGIWLCFSVINIDELTAEEKLKNARLTIKGQLEQKWEAEWNDDGRPTLYGYDYYFIHPDIGQISNTSFSSKVLDLVNLKEVEVVYVEDNPYLNKIVGMDYTDKSKASLLIILIPFVGLALFMIGVKKAKFNAHILQVGKFTWGKFIRQERTNVEINDQPQYRLYFEYSANDGGKYQQKLLTTKPSDYDKEELVIFDPNKPADSVLLYNLSYALAKYIDKNWEDANI